MAPTTLGALASKIRSKNAGPFWVTIDVFLPDDEAFTRAAAAPCLTADRIAGIYGANPSMVKIFRISELRTIKVSFPRSVPQGSTGDRDVHSAQQYIPLAAQPA
ncbi:DUF4387 domain-containing protein [Pseudonocardia kujensis]|uniref:DUF4387 domain-containing protein n=1 Tax=Pseudonocardia kujensis TaxID=1128675 RepID=UPI001E5C7DFC|nr:DUF4387 domain-containing protein [Pseudonocardia kujensis]MCE0763702.1 DUF4387 domain-containing protein [Pseudonocardia kujensis]